MVPGGAFDVESIEWKRCVYPGKFLQSKNKLKLNYDDHDDDNDDEHDDDEHDGQDKHDDDQDNRDDDHDDDDHDDFLPNVTHNWRWCTDGSLAVGSSAETDYDGIPSQVLGAPDPHAELGFTACENVEESILLDVEGPLYNWGRSGGWALESPVDLSEVTEPDEAPLLDLPFCLLLWLAGVQTDRIVG